MRSIVLAALLSAAAIPVAAHAQTAGVVSETSLSTVGAAGRVEGLPGRRGWAMLIVGFAAGASAMRAGGRKTWR